jgi:hypothetical protein
MKKTNLFILAIFISFCSIAQDVPGIPEDFGESAYTHIKKLCDPGVRRHDNPSGLSAVMYIKEQFEKYGLQCKIDTCYFGSVNVKDRKILINGDSIIVQTVLLNQALKPDMIIEGEGIILEGNNSNGHDLVDKIIYTTKSNNTLLLKKYDPKAIVVLRNEELKKIKDIKETELILKGNSIEQLGKSYNVIATYKNYQLSHKDIILTAHWDSQTGPGADDNASGVSLLLELSKYFLAFQAQTPYNLKFVATGAEEIGLTGSKAYALKYSDDIVENALLNFNIDAVGGGQKPYIEMRRPANFKNPDTGEWLQIISSPDNSYHWYTSFLEVYRNSSYEDMYPEWMVEDIKTAMKKAHIKFYKAPCCSGADHRSFAYLELPTIYLSTIRKNEKNTHHSINDVPKDYFKDNLQLAGKTAQRILFEICW